MSLGATLIQFSAGEDIHASDMNANFSALNGVGFINGTVTHVTSTQELQTSGGSPAITVDGNGLCIFQTTPPLDSAGNHMETFSLCSGYGGGTFMHNYSGLTDPAEVFPMVNSAGNSEGLGVDSKGSVTFHLNMPTAFPWFAFTTKVV